MYILFTHKHPFVSYRNQNKKNKDVKSTYTKNTSMSTYTAHDIVVEM